MRKRERQRKMSEREERPRPKGKGKGKGGAARPPMMRPRPTSGPSAAAPSSASDSVCLRCGKAGRGARECPTPPRKGPSTNRDSEAVVMMVTDAIQAEQLSEVLLQADSRAAKEAVSDGHACGLLARSRRRLVAQPLQLRQHVPIWQRWDASLSQNFAGKAGHLHAHVLLDNAVLCS